MKAALLIGMLTVATVLGAQTPDNAAQGVPNPAVSVNPAYPTTQANSGAVLSAELTRSLDARKVKPGGIVFAKCTQDLNMNGEILIPRNAKLVGHIASVQTKGRGKPESTLVIAFDKAVMRDGREVRLTASIQALAPPAILATDLASSDFLPQKPAPAKPRSSALFPGTLKARAPESSTTVIAPALAPNTTGVIGLKGLQLNADSSLAPNASVIRSNFQNVRLESGTRLILRVSLP